MSKGYRSRSSRHERSSRWGKNNEIDIVEAAADQAIEHLKTPEFSSQGRASRHEATREKSSTLPVMSYLLLTVLSILLGISFYAFPFWNHLATPLQSQNLYSGMAMQHGLVPFNDFYGTGGTLFYLINWLGNFGGSTLLLWIFEVIALLVSGILAHQLVIAQTNNTSAATITSSFTLVIIAGLARGGDAPTLFALPFAFWAVHFLNHYFQKDSTDRGFIRFGTAGALSFVIAPIMSLFFLFSAVALLVYNLSHRRFWHGFYQMLATILGILIVGYLVAYYALEEQTIYTSIEQSVLIPLTHFGPTGDLPLTLAKAVVLTLVFGIVTGFVQGVLQLKTAQHAKIWYLIMLVGILVVTTGVVFAETFDSSNLLAVLPFIIIFAGPGIKDSPQLLLKYLQNRLFAPIMGILFVVLAPFAYQYMNKATFSEEKVVAQYLQDKVKATDRVYVLAADKNINQLTHTVASVDTVPTHYPVKFEQNYELQVENLKDKFVVLEAGQNVTGKLKKTLDEHYKLSKSTQQFLVYQRN